MGVLVVASACVEAGPVRCLLDRMVTRTRFEEGHIVEIAGQLECGHQERDEEEENYSSYEEDYNSDEDEDSSDEDDSNEDDYHDKAESEGSSSTSTTSAASTHAAAAGAGAGDAPQEIGPVTEHVDDYNNEVYDICGDLPGESKC